jgi:hypothetical protein
MNETKNTAAYCAASLTAQLKLDTMLEVGKAWEQFYDTILNKMGYEAGYDTPPAHTGGRDIPMVKKPMSQEDIAAKVEAVSNKSGIVVVGTGALPDDAEEWARKRGFTHVFDNRPWQIENPKRPAFKAVDANGNDIKDETGKTMSYWGNKK